MTRARLSIFAALALVAGAWAFRSSRSAASDPVPAKPAPSARLAIAHGEIDGFETEVAFADIGAGNVAALTPLAKIAHEKGSAVRGAARGDQVFVTARVEAPRGTSFGAALYRVEKGKVTRLCRDVETATAPHLTASGRVIVARGVDGPEPTAAEAKQLKLRDDELSIDDVDPVTGAVRTLFREKGQQAFLATELPTGELVIYLSTRAGSSLLALDPSTTTTRVLSSHVAPFARDFSFDRTHGELVFANLSSDRRTYEILALSSATRVLFRTPNEHTMPFALSGGDVAFSSDGDHGLAILSTVSGTVRARLVAPLGDGSDAVTHEGTGFVALRHTPPSGPVEVVAYDVGASRVVRLGAPPGHFVEPLGFVGGGAP